MRKIILSDYTLRKEAETRSGGMLFREKVAVASCLEEIGVDRIELPPVTREKEDGIIFKTIADLVKEKEIAIPVGFTAESVEKAWECIQTAARPCLQVILPVSTAQMEYSFRAKEKTMLENIGKLVSLAKEKCSRVEFVAQNATGADPTFLLEAIKTAEENGAELITVCDDTGDSLPEEIGSVVKKIKNACSSPLLVCLSDSIRTANASALTALAAGADGVKTSIVGEDVLLTGDFARTLARRGASLGLASSLKTTEIHRDIGETVRRLKEQGTPVFSPETEGKDIFLDEKSSFADLCRAIRLLGYDLSEEDCGKVQKALLRVCERKHSVGAKELEALIASNAMQVPSTYHLVRFSATCSNVVPSMAEVVLRCGEETVNGLATGDGPIESAFRAIEQGIGFHYELDDFQIQSVTEGKEALGSALVRLRSHGKLFAGNGLSTDIVGASIRAYLNALNKIIYEENDRTDR